MATFGPLIDALLPEAADRFLAKVLGKTMPREGAGGLYRILVAGRFDGRIGADLLAFAQNHAQNGALVLGDADCVRVLYFQGGTVVGADSDVIFERFGRTLQRHKAIPEEEAKAVLDLEESAGIVAASGLVSAEVLRLGLERRVWDIGTAIPFMHGAHFLLVSGVPNLAGLPVLAIPPMDLALEGARRYDEWRNTSSKRPEPNAPAPPTAPTASAPKGPTAAPAPTAGEPRSRERVSGARPRGTAGLPDLPPRHGRASATVPGSH